MVQCTIQHPEFEEDSQVGRVLSRWTEQVAGPRFERDREGLERLLKLQVVFRAPAGLTAKVLDDLQSVKWLVPNVMVAVPANDGGVLSFWWHEERELRDVIPPPPEAPPDMEVEFPKEEETSEPAWIRWRTSPDSIWVEVVTDRKSDTFGFRIRHDKELINLTCTAFRGASLVDNDSLVVREYARIRDTLVVELKTKLVGISSIHLTACATGTRGVEEFLPFGVVFLQRDAVRLALEGIRGEERPMVIVSARE